MLLYAVTTHLLSTLTIFHIFLNSPFVHLDYLYRRFTLEYNFCGRSPSHRSSLLPSFPSLKYFIYVNNINILLEYKEYSKNIKRHTNLLRSIKIDMVVILFTILYNSLNIQPKIISHFFSYILPLCI